MLDEPSWRRGMGVQRLPSSLVLSLSPPFVVWNSRHLDENKANPIHMLINTMKISNCKQIASKRLWKLARHRPVFKRRGLFKDRWELKPNKR
jgi:hypothetical protein